MTFLYGTSILLIYFEYIPWKIISFVKQVILGCLFTWQWSLKRKYRHFGENFVPGYMRNCNFDNFQVSQWCKFHRKDNISVSVSFIIVTTFWWLPGIVQSVVHISVTNNTVFIQPGLWPSHNFDSIVLCYVLPACPRCWLPTHVVVAVCALPRLECPRVLSDRRDPAQWREATGRRGWIGHCHKRVRSCGRRPLCWE